MCFNKTFIIGVSLLIFACRGVAFAKTIPTGNALLLPEENKKPVVLSDSCASLGDAYTQCSINEMIMLSGQFVVLNNTKSLASSCEWGNVLSQGTKFESSCLFKSAHANTDVKFKREASSKTYCCHSKTSSEHTLKDKSAHKYAFFLSRSLDCGSNHNVCPHKEFATITANAAIEFEGAHLVKGGGGLANKWMVLADGSVFHADNPPKSLVALCCSSSSSGHSPPVPNTLQHAPSAPRHVMSVRSASSKGRWAPVAPYLYGLVLARGDGLYARPLWADTSADPVASSDTLDLNAADVNITVIDPWADDVKSIQQLWCSAPFGNVCGTYSVVYKTGKRAQFDTSSSSIEALAKLLGVSSTSPAECSGVRLGSTGFLIHTDGNGQYVLSKTDSALPWVKGEKSRYDVGVVTDVFKGYAAFPNQKNASLEGPIISTMSFHSVASSLLFFNGVSGGASGRDPRTFVWVCQSDTCFRNGNYSSTDVLHNVVSKNSDENTFATSDVFSETGALSNPYLRDAIFVLARFHFPHSRHLGRFFYSLLQNYNGKSDNDGLQLGYYNLLWYSKQWDIAKNGNEQQTLHPLSSLESVATKSMKLANAAYDDIPELQFSAKDAMEGFELFTTQMENTWDLLEKLQVEDIILEDVSNIAKGLAENQNTYASYTNEKVKAESERIKMLNITVTELSNSLNNATNAIVADIKSVSEAIQAAIKRKQEAMTFALTADFTSNVMGGLHTFTSTMYLFQTRTYVGREWANMLRNHLFDFREKANNVLESSYFTALNVYKYGAWDQASSGVEDSESAGLQCLSSYTQDFTNLLVAGSAIQAVDSHFTVDEIINLQPLVNATSAVLTGATDASASAKACLEPILQEFAGLCIELSVSCDKLIGDMNALISQGDSIKQMYRTLATVIFNKINMKLTSQMYNMTAAQWGPIEEEFKEDKSAVDVVISGQYNSLVSLLTLFSDTLIDWCLSASYRYGIAFNQVSEECTNIPNFLPTDSLTSFTKFLKVSDEAKQLSLKYGGEINNVQWVSEDDSLLHIPNKNVQSLAGFDLKGFLNSRVTDHDHFVYTGALTIPFNEQWIAKHLKMNDEFVSAKIAAAKVVFQGLKNSGCSYIEGTIQPPTVAAYYSQQGDRMKKILVRPPVYGQQFRYNPETLKFETVPSFCGVDETGLNCNTENMNYPVYGIVPTLNGEYTITIRVRKDASNGCQMDPSSITGIGFDYQAFTYSDSAKK